MEVIRFFCSIYYLSFLCFLFTQVMTRSWLILELFCFTHPNSPLRWASSIACFPAKGLSSTVYLSAGHASWSPLKHDCHQITFALKTTNTVPLLFWYLEYHMCQYQFLYLIHYPKQKETGMQGEVKRKQRKCIIYVNVCMKAFQSSFRDFASQNTALAYSVSTPSSHQYWLWETRTHPSDPSFMWALIPHSIRILSENKIV